MPSGTPLPPLESPQFQGSGLHERPNAVAAYEKVLKAEALAVQDGRNQDLVHARVAGYLILELYDRRDVLGDQAFTTVINDVIQTSQDREGEGDNSVVYGVGKRYLENLVRPGGFDRCLFYVCSSSNVNRSLVMALGTWHPAFTNPPPPSPPSAHL